MPFSKLIETRMHYGQFKSQGNIAFAQGSAHMQRDLQVVRNLRFGEHVTVSEPTVVCKSSTKSHEQSNCRAIVALGIDSSEHKVPVPKPALRAHQSNQRTCCHIYQ